MKRLFRVIVAGLAFIANVYIGFILHELVDIFSKPAEPDKWFDEWVNSLDDTQPVRVPPYAWELEKWAEESE